MSNRSNLRRTITLILALAVVAAACGDDDDVASTEGAPVDSAAPRETAAPAETAPADGTAPGATDGEASGPQDLVVGRADSILGFNADFCLTRSTNATLPMVYGTLLDWTADGQDVQPGLAESFEYDAAASTYTLTLRDGLLFSDGSDLTSADVAFSVEQWKAGTINGGLFADIASVDTPDDRTVVLNLSTPNTYIEALLSWCVSAVYPEDFGGVAADDYFQAPVGAGPFTLQAWNNPGPSEEIVLAKNPNYWQEGLPILDTLTFRANTDPNQRLLAYESGDLDMIETLEFESVPTVPADELLVAPNMPIVLLLLNTRVPGLDDINVRQAIAAAIDRETLTQLYEGYAEPATGVLPANVPFSADPTTPFHFDLDEARQLMADSEHPDGLQFELLADQGEAALAQVVATQLAEIGVDLAITIVDNGTLFDRGGEGDFDMQLNGNVATSPSALDPIIATQVIEWYYTAMPADLAAADLAAALASDDDAERAQLVGSIQDALVEQAGQIGMVTLASLYAVKPYVKGVEPFPYLRWYPQTVSLTEH